MWAPHPFPRIVIFHSVSLVAGGGDVKIENQKLTFKEKAQSKVGSLDNVGHMPAGGMVKVRARQRRGVVSSCLLHLAVPGPLSVPQSFISVILSISMMPH